MKETQASTRKFSFKHEYQREGEIFYKNSGVSGNGGVTRGKSEQRTNYNIYPPIGGSNHNYFEYERRWYLVVDGDKK